MELVTLLVALLSLVMACAALLLSLRATRVASINTAQSAYAQAVKGLLDLKRRAAEQPEIFQPSWKSYLPQAPARQNASLSQLSLGAEDIWQLSLALSLIQRGKTAGLTEHQSQSLKVELVEWLRGLSGFYEVYRFHTPLLERHHPESLAFLRERLYTPAFERAAAQQRKEQELIRRYGANCLRQRSIHRDSSAAPKPRANGHKSGVTSLENLVPLALVGTNHTN
ncbi:MAG TPA: hypothetical protein VF099_09940 [Ktedonobacterales bacterium]